MNFFAYTSAAERYAQSRPYFHPLVMEKIKAYLQLTEPIPQAIDVGCGTGQSTVALREIADDVTGADVSAEMLAVAKQVPGVRYVQSPAESLPFPDASFDLMTVSLALHWFDRAKFLTEAHRVIKPGGRLIVYTNGFYGQMKENDIFEMWNDNTYLRRYPIPPRNKQPITNPEEFHLEFVGREVYTNDIVFTPEQLVAYLTTQSNVIAHVEQGKESIEDVYAWLLNDINPLFRDTTATFTFGGSIAYFQVSSPP